ncbi:hypothetical protein ACNAW0_05740 [Micromonospora sp. SL1-18]|uniref:hypothetical protein n=1 Tax=Micromonospora sp. SL1-18 TaxID=3399128 RepID=UPI003A4D69D1
MWPWRRRSQRTAQRSTADAPAPGSSETGGGPEGATPTGDATAGSTPASAPAHRQDEPAAWLGLPPIQRITPEEPRLNLPEAFTGSLAAWRDPSYLAPLGHLVGAAEPAGVLHGAVEPASEPTRADLEPTGRPRGDDPAPLPLATPPANPSRATPSLQRQVTGPAPGQRPATASPAPDQRQVASASAQGQRTVPDPPAAPLPVQSVPLEPVTVSQPVPLEPVTLSRLLTAPPLAVELHLPTVDRPTDAAQRVVDSDLSGPADAPETPTLGRDFPAATAEASGPDVALPEPSPSAGIAEPAASGTRQSVSDLPVQRVPADAPRPPRRLGLGEPIVSPLLPPAETSAPATHDYTSVRDAAPLQRLSTEGDGRVLAHRPPTGEGEAAVAPAGNAGQQDGGGNGPVASTTTADDQAGLLGEVAVSRLAADATPTTAIDPGWLHGDTETDGAAMPADDLPVVGTATARTFQGDTAQPGNIAASGGEPAGSGTGGSPVQTFVPSHDGTATEARVVPLLAQPPAPTASGGEPAGTADQGDRAADPAGGRETGARGPDDAAAPLPVVVARLVGDRPVRPLTREMPAAPAPARPSVQRVTWQHDEEPVPAAAAPLALPDPQQPQPSLFADVPDLLSTPAAVHVGAAGGIGPVPVQRWVGALPGSPPPVPPARSGSGGNGPPMAYLGGGPEPAATAPRRDPPAPVVQRAEPADAPPPADAPGPAATPPPDGGPPAAGPPAAPGAKPAGGVEPEELLKKLYDPLLRRLKTELRLDRERHGVLGGPG